MKKLFTLLTLALVSIGSAWGQDVLIKEVDFTSSAWAAQRAAEKFTSSDGTIDGCTATGDLLMTKAGEMNFANSNMAKNGSNALVIPLEGINGSVKIVVTSTEANVRFNWFVAEGDAECTDRNGTTAGTTEVSYTMTTTATTGTLYMGRRGSSDKIAITKIQVYTADASVTNEITEVTLNGEALSDANLTTLLSSKALTVATAFDGLPIVKYTITTKSGDEVLGTTENNVVVEKDGENYKAAFSFGGTDYAITFTNINLVTCLDVTTNNTEVILSQDNIAAKGYLDCKDTHFTDKKWPAPYNGKFLDMKSGRTITITVKNVTAFEVYASGKDGEERTYTVKVGEADAVSYTQGSSSSIVSSGIITTGTTDEVTIVLEGGSSSVYPAYIVFNPAVDAEITSAGYATFSSDKAVDFSGASGVTVYAAKVNDAKTAVDLIEVKSKQVPANTAVVLKGAAGTYSATAIASAATISGNQLQIAATTMDGSAGNIFVLNEVSGVVGFYKLSASGSLLAGKGYLVVDGVGEGRAMLEIDIDGISTGINMVNGEGLKVNGSETYYDLQGRRVLNPTKGLYIVNGKKVIVK